MDTVPKGSKKLKVQVVSGAGLESMHGAFIYLKITDNALCFYDLRNVIKKEISYNRLRAVQIGGPGKVTNSPGIIGGGFGEGALVGMGVATVANILLTHSNTKTIIWMLLDNTEIIFISKSEEPDNMRIILSPCFVAVARNNSNRTVGIGDINVIDQLKELKELRNSGALDEEQYAKAIDKIIS